MKRHGGFDSFFPLCLVPPNTNLNAAAKPLRFVIAVFQRFSPTSRIWIALILTLVVFSARYLSKMKAPGIDFWHTRAILAVGNRERNIDVYSRSGRETIYQRTVVPQLNSTDLGSYERNAALRSAVFDVAFLGYEGSDVVQTPFLIALMRPFISLSYNLAHEFYTFVSLLCFFGAAYVLSRLLGFSVAVSLCIAAVAGIIFKPESDEMVMANTNNLQLWLIALFLWLQQRANQWSDLASGVMLALAIALKPNVALILPAVGIVWAGERRWGKILSVEVGVLAGAVIAFATTSLVTPSIKWSSWFSIFRELMNSAQTFESGNIALASLITHSLGFEASRPLLLIGALLLTVVALKALWSSPRAGTNHDVFPKTFLAVNAGVLLMLFSSRIVWGHYFVLALPSTLWIARESIDRRGASGLIGALTLFLFSSFPSIALTSAREGWLLGLTLWNVALVIMSVWALHGLWIGSAHGATAPLLPAEKFAE